MIRLSVPWLSLMCIGLFSTTAVAQEASSEVRVDDPASLPALESDVSRTADDLSLSGGDLSTSVADTSMVKDRGVTEPIRPSGRISVTGPDLRLFELPNNEAPRDKVTIFDDL